MLTVTFAQAHLPESGALALLLPEGTPLAGLAKAADEATGGALERAFAAAHFTGKKGSICTLLAPGAGLSRIVAIGLGKEDELTPFLVEEAGGRAAVALAKEAESCLAPVPRRWGRCCAPTASTNTAPRRRPKTSPSSPN
jgi:leucyl aminopeptidase